MTYRYLFLAWLLVIPPHGLAETLKIVTFDLAPFGYEELDSAPKGIFYEFANQVAQEAGVRYSNKVVPYARAVHELEKGKADMTIMLLNDRIKKIAIPIEPILKIENVVVGLPSSQYKHYEDLKGKTLGSIRNAVYDQRVSQDKEIALFYTNNYQQSINMLLAKRFEGIIGVKKSIFFELARLGYPVGTLSSPMIINQKEPWLLISRKANLSDEIIERIRNAIVRLKQNPQFEQLLRKYEVK